MQATAEDQFITHVAQAVLQRNRPWGYDDDGWNAKIVHDVRWHLERYCAQTGQSFEPAAPLRLMHPDERPRWWQRLVPLRHS